MARIHHKAYILTGTPGSGKTSLINCLKDRGEQVYEEPTRKILNEQLSIDGPALPAKDPTLFIQAMLDDLLSNFTNMPSNRTFSDRGIPDLVAYDHRFGVEPLLFREAASRYRYNLTVFLLEPWEDIFENDEVRKLSFETSQQFHQLLVEIYQQHDYHLVSVPKVDIEARADFVLTFC